MEAERPGATLAVSEGKIEVPIEKSPANLVPLWTVKASPGFAMIDGALNFDALQPPPGSVHVTETMVGFAAAIAGALVPKPATATTPAAARIFRARTINLYSWASPLGVPECYSPRRTHPAALRGNPSPATATVRSVCLPFTASLENPKSTGGITGLTFLQKIGRLTIRSCT